MHPMSWPARARSCVAACVLVLCACAAPQQPVGEGQVLCKRCGKVGPKLARPPFKSEFGQEIYDKICGLCWREAIAMGTKVINELRLPLADPKAQQVWDQHIREFLGL